MDGNRPRGRGVPPSSGFRGGPPTRPRFRPPGPPSESSGFGRGYVRPQRGVAPLRPYSPPESMAPTQGSVAQMSDLESVASGFSGLATSEYSGVGGATSLETSRSSGSTDTMKEYSPQQTGNITTESQEEKDKDPGPIYYRGDAGKPINVASNYLELRFEGDKGVFEYEVQFSPQVDNSRERYRLLAQQREIIGSDRSFDGVKLYLPKELGQQKTVLTSTDSQSGDNINLTITLKRKEDRFCPNMVQFFNIIFNRMFKYMDFIEHNRKYFDAESPYEIRDYRLQVWPGFVTAVDFYEKGLLLQIDVSHRVVRTETVHEYLKSLLDRVGANNFKAEAEKGLIGSSILTKYNNRSYIIDDVDFVASPKDTFADSQGNQISYVEYYKKQYSIDIVDKNQPMLINRPKDKHPGETTATKLICLVPEQCLLTGMTESMRADFRIMKAVGNYTRATPQQRKTSIAKFIERINNCEKARDMLKAWGLALSPNPLALTARVLPSEQLVFDQNKMVMTDTKGDWGRAATSNKALVGVTISKWGVVYVKSHETKVRAFVQSLCQQGAKMGINFPQPGTFALENDRTETFVNKLRTIIDPSVQLLMIVTPQQRTDRYAAIKKLCCVEKPIATQVILLKTLSNEKRLMSVAQKVALQINCKLGGELWGCGNLKGICQSPKQTLMVIGIDVFHDKSRKIGSIAGLVASINPTMSKYYSTVAVQKQGQELTDAIKVAFIDALINYHSNNNAFPTNIVVFRDGVSDSQMPALNHEVQQFIAAFTYVDLGEKPETPEERARRKILGEDSPEIKEKLARLRKYMPNEYKPGFNFVVVQKRINTRVFQARNIDPATGSTLNAQFDNPPAGTVLDHTVTRRQFKDFFLIPQSVSQGTVNPTHFVVIEESGEKPLDANGIQRLAFRLTHMYFNWPGTVRVPAPCQYAHKLCDLVGENIKTQPDPNLSNKLYYL